MDQNYNSSQSHLVYSHITLKHQFSYDHRFSRKSQVIMSKGLNMLVITWWLCEVLLQQTRVLSFFPTFTLSFGYNYSEWPNCPSFPLSQSIGIKKKIWQLSSNKKFACRSWSINTAWICECWKNTSVPEQVSAVGFSLPLWPT